MMRALCVILQLGNLTFGPDPANDDHTIVLNTDELGKLSEIMGISASLLNAALTERTITARGETHKVLLKVREAMDARDALAKEIYARLFDWLVKFINAATLGEKQNDNEHSYRNIGLLDLFGFEAFDVNRFEQLCINYANEKLQYKYARDNFRSLQEEYEAEGIDLFDFASVDNSSILNLIESRLGLFAVLNEECVLPNGNAKSFVYKAKKVHKDQPALVKKLLHGPSEFGIKHFAGDVVYDASEFIACNKDSISVDLIECASKSSNSLISDEFIKLSNEKKELSQVKGRRGAIFNQMTCTKFKSQVTSLMAVIDQSRTQFIRCIKPNKSMKPYVTDHTHTLVQLSSAGLLTAITIVRESYPDNLLYDEVFDRFQCLVPIAVSSDTNLKDQVSTLLSTVLDGMEKAVGSKMSYPFALGKTKVYFRVGSLEILESDRLNMYTKHALFIQSCVRRNLAMLKFAKMKEAVTLLRAHVLRKLTRTKYLKCRAGVIMLQTWIRRVLACDELLDLRKVDAAKNIQKRWRSRAPRIEFSKFKNATLLLQNVIRRAKNRTNFSSAMAACVEAARKDNTRIKLQHIISQEVAVHNSSGTDPWVLLGQCNKIMGDLGSNLYEVRHSCSDMKDEVRESKETISHLNTALQYSEAAYQAIKNNSNSSDVNTQKIQGQLRDSKMKINRHGKLLKFVNANHADYKRMKENELFELRQTIERNEREAAQEREASNKEVVKLVLQMKKERNNERKSLKQENARLQDNIKSMQEGYNDDIAQMLNVIEEREETKSAYDDDGENEVSALKIEIAKLKAQHSAEMTGLRNQQRSRSSISRQATLGI
mmetsp:Transcript_35172/g.40706  ORF Transcript_35172/g.40706 Transcript_35172/m.40706 type:complete len:828 (+) Transcript_35172:1487-3970(+)